MLAVETAFWNEAKRRESERVAARHEKMRAEGKTSSAVYDPSRVQKPWTWRSTGMGPLFDLDESMIASVRTFDFDLDDEGFQAFLAATYHLHLCRSPQGAYWNALQDRNNVDESAFLSNERLGRAEEHAGTTHMFSDAEMHGHWRIFSRTRVFIQGAWDVFIGRADVPDGLARCALSMREEAGKAHA